MPDPQIIGFIGLGAMGQAMAGRLLRRGFVVQGADINPQAVQNLVAQGGVAAASPKDAAGGACAVVVMVHDASQVEAVLFGEQGVLTSLPPGAAIWLASTVPPAYARALCERLLAQDIHLLDGPVSGGRTSALAGALTVMAGGSDIAFQKLESVMRGCAGHVHHLGPAGVGSTAKLINQILVATHTALTAEALALGERAGLNLEQLVEVVRQSSGNSVMFEKRAPRMIAHDHEAQATLDIFLKDLGIVLDVAGEHGAMTPLTETARRLYAQAAENGGGARSDTHLFDLFRQAGTRVESQAQVKP